MTDVDVEARVAALGLEIPDYANPPYGERCGKLKAFHRTGDLVMFSGITAESREGEVFQPGILGRELTVEQGRMAARQAALNCLGMIRFALGSLNEVAGVARVLNFVAATPDFADHHLVGDGVTELFLEAFGSEIGLAGRATVGAASLSRRNCIELWLTVEARSTAEPR